MGGLDTEVGAEDGVVAAPRFGASHALITFGLMLFAQFAVGGGLAAMGILAVLASGRDPNDPQFTSELLAQILVPTLYGGAIITTIVTLLALRLFAWHLVRDRSAAGLGAFVPPLRQLLLWTLIGLALGALYLALTKIVPTDWRGGPLAKVAASGGSGRVAWTILALLFAPFVEELLFRGLMLRGMLASWGVKAASVIVTVLFFTLHLFETSGYWPAMLAILSLSLATLFARLRTGSVVTSMAVHGAYNAALVVAVYSTMIR